jgi:dolichyl-diphosphooligosaccharide--protein glycosyltransferase
VAYAPALLFGGVVGLLVVAETVHRLDLPVAALGGVQAVLVVVGPLAFRAVLPTFWTRLAEELGRLFGRFGDARIAETQSLFGADSFGWLLLFGFTLVLALPYVGWASREAYRGSKPWLAASVYGWYFLVLAGIQLRFAGELSPFVALFAGLGFVHIAERIDLARKPVPLRTETGRPADGDASRSIPLPDRRTLGGLAVLFLLVGGLGMLQIPVKTSQLQYSDSEYRAAVWTAEYADAEDMTYPENYVLSSWGDNRMYNYFVNGEARCYNYARENYTPFINSTDASGWGDRFVGRVGFVVTEDISAPPETNQARLHRAYGSRSSGGPGLAHYRAVFVTDDGSRKVFEVVPGATVSGTVTGGPTTIATTVELDGTSFTYERRIEPDANGRFNVTVPYPGTYEVGNRTVEVPETSVRSGGRVTVGG